MFDAFFMVQVRALEQPPHHDSEQAMRKHNGKCVDHSVAFNPLPVAICVIAAIHYGVNITAIIHISMPVSEIRLTGR